MFLLCGIISHVFETRLHLLTEPRSQVVSTVLRIRKVQGLNLGTDPGFPD
jgi:hypothetical protein